MVVVHDFAKPKSKHALSVHLKNAPEDKERRWRKDAIDAFVSHEELVDWMEAGGIDHGELSGLADDDHTQYILASGTRELTGDWDAGSFEIRAKTFESDVATGTAPLVVDSTTKVANLNADLLDDQSGAYYLDSANFTGTNWTDLTDLGETTLHSHAGGGGVTDHGALTGLDDNDHPQYILAIDDAIAGNFASLTHDGEISDSGWDSSDFVLYGYTYDHGGLNGLADDDHTQYLLANGTRALTADWDAGSFEVRAQTFESDVATGTAPIVVSSTTEVTNLNSEFWNGLGVSGTPAAEIDEFLTYFDSGSYISITGSGYNNTSFFPRLADDASVTMTVYNNTGSQINALKVCYISGDSSGTPLITLADADAESSASKMLVIAAANIANASSGSVIIYGWVGGLSSLTAGAIQYLSTTDGGITETAPSATGDIVRIVGYAMSATEMFFNPDKTYIELK